MAPFKRAQTSRVKYFVVVEALVGQERRVRANVIVGVRLFGVIVGSGGVQLVAVVFGGVLVDHHRMGVENVLLGHEETDAEVRVGAGNRLFKVEEEVARG